MKTKIIPFDLETAKKIQAGEIEGRIKTRDSKDIDEIAFFLKNSPLYKIYANINGRFHSFTEEGYERSWDDSGTWRGDLVLEVPDNEPQELQFKPFDKVLVREGEVWYPRFFSNYEQEEPHYAMTDNCCYWECIPFAGNEHLVGTTDEPKEE